MFTFGKLPLLVVRSYTWLEKPVPILDLLSVLGGCKYPPPNRCRKVPLVIVLQMDWSFAWGWIKDNNHHAPFRDSFQTTFEGLSCTFVSCFFFFCFAPDVCREQPQLHQDFEKDKKKEKRKTREGGLGVGCEPAEMGVPFSDHSPSFSRSDKIVNPCYLIVAGVIFVLFFFMLNANFCSALAIFFFSLVSRNQWNST